MTSAHAPADYKAFQWVPPSKYTIERNRAPVGRPGIAEIKPHTESGITGGLRQLRRPTVPRGPQRWLLAYEIVAPPRGGKPGRVRVFAYLVTDNDRRGPWAVGHAPIPPKIDFPSLSYYPAFVGMAIEPIVWQAFTRWLPPGATVSRDTGGARRGADMIWTELASFYAELAGETADPFFEELAAELSAIAQPDATAAAAGPDPGQLRACLAACAAGGPGIAAFCATLPDPRLKAACYALYFAGEVACNGWCYWQFA